jgi:hypothetical protein
MPRPRTSSKASTNPPTTARGSVGSGSLRGHPEMDGPAIQSRMQSGSTKDRRRAARRPVLWCSRKTGAARHRPLHSGLSLPVSPADRLGRGSNNDCSRVSRHHIIESCRDRDVGSHCRINRCHIIECCRGRGVCSYGCRSLRSTRGDLVELTVCQCYRSFSIRYPDGCQQCRCDYQTNNLTTHRVSSP